MEQPQTFDIMKMGRKVQGKAKRKRTVQLIAGAALFGFGLARGRLSGAALAAIGLNWLVTQVTGKSIVNQIRSRLAPTQLPAAAGGKHFGNGRRDHVDEASWESFPASDPPAYYPSSN